MEFNINDFMGDVSQAIEEESNRSVGQSPVDLFIEKEVYLAKITDVREQVSDKWQYFDIVDRDGKVQGNQELQSIGLSIDYELIPVPAKDLAGIWDDTRPTYSTKYCYTWMGRSSDGGLTLARHKGSTGKDTYIASAFAQFLGAINPETVKINDYEFLDETPTLKNSFDFSKAVGTVVLFGAKFETSQDGQYTNLRPSFIAHLDTFRD